jgi:MYXO-CTERM domain-containing protein
MHVLPARQRLTLSVPLVGLVILIPSLLPSRAHAQEPPTAAGLGVEVGIDQDPAIYGGSAVESCGWPTAVFINLGGSACSGTLVHPQVVITAAHCAGNGVQADVGFGEGQGGGAEYVGATCYANPNYNGSSSSDYAYCRLDSPVNDVPIVPPAFGCETSALTVGREVVIVGFGQSNNGGSGTKREVTTTINAITTEAFIGGNGEDSCQGDSGGPVYIKMASEFGGDDTWRAFGITSSGGQCGTGGYYALMHQAIPWIENHSDIDITPCHNSSGDWEPNPDCGGFPLDPANGVGNWGNGCSGGPVSGFSALCGEPFGAGEDPDPPTVNITSPASGTVFMLPGGDTQINVTLDASADDGDGFGVENVRLRINGQEFPGNSDTSEPYSWNLGFVAGGYIIEAVATDFVGNESVADVISIGIDQDAPPLPGEGGDGDGDPGGDGDGDPGDGDSGGDGDGDDTGPLTSGGETGLGGFDGGGDTTATIGCACSTEDDERGGTLGLLGMLGLWGVRRRQAVRDIVASRRKSCAPPGPAGLS